MAIGDLYYDHALNLHFNRRPRAFLPKDRSFLLPTSFVVLKYPSNFPSPRAKAFAVRRPIDREAAPARYVDAHTPSSHGIILIIRSRSRSIGSSVQIDRPRCACSDASAASASRRRTTTPATTTAPLLMCLVLIGKGMVASRARGRRRARAGDVRARHPPSRRERRSGGGRLHIIEQRQQQR